MASGVVSEFPVDGLLPKKESGALNYLNKYPDYDGKEVVIAIFDSGVDPGASGLQVTPTGETKVIDLYDATGSGDVDTSTIVEANDGEITGLTGRKLKIPVDCTNPSGKFHIGVKTAYSIFPSSLIPRVKKERKELMWTRAHNDLLAEAHKAKEESDKQPVKPAASETEKLTKSEIDSKIELLNSLADKYEDCGPVYDCVVFYDGNTWRAYVDTSEVGDLGACKPMASYREEHQFSRFSDQDMLNFSVNIYEDGNVLEICTGASSHGTHVASIAAAYEPENPERNGVAPGAKIVSVKVGDSRLKTEETGTALIRGMIRAIEMKCDVINLSYGESARFLMAGRIKEMIDEVVNKHGIFFFTSAGNSGPALTTVGSPASMSSAAIGVGAYVTPDMMSAAYSMRDKLPCNTYTWSSRGPTSDGAMGVCISAAGGAITSIPNYNLSGSKLMNGTSMSSPNATGCMALVLSGLKQRGIPYTAASARRAMVNTAKPMEGVEPLALGHGAFQVDRMFEYMTQYHNLPEDCITFDVSVGGTRERGIYVREPSELIFKQQTFRVCVTPTFVTNCPEDHGKLEEKKAMIEFNKTLALTCGESWVCVPTHVQLMNSERDFSVKLDVESLGPGLHFSEILGYDISCIEKGPLIRVPVTVCKPESVSDSTDHQYKWKGTFSPGQIRRHFLTVPIGATCATVKILTTKSEEPNTLLCMHAVTLVPGCIFQELEHEHLGYYKAGGAEGVVTFRVQVLPNKNAQQSMVHSRLKVGAGETRTRKISLMGNCTMELCMAKWWSNAGKTDIEYSVQFSGVTVDRPTLMHAGHSVTQIDVTSLLRTQSISPSITFNSLVQTIRPSKATIAPLTSSRDQTPDGVIVYSLVMEYNFKMAKTGEVTPDFPMLSSFLYENPFGCQIWLLFDENKQHLLTGDAYPVRYKYSSKLTSGDYTIKLQLRHTDTKLLEKSKRSPMLLRHSLGSNTVTMPAYTAEKEAVVGGRTTGSVSIPQLGTKSLFFRALNDDQLKNVPVAPSAGVYLDGNLSLIKSFEPSNQKFHYVLCESCTLSDGNCKASPEEKDKQTEHKEAKIKLDSQWITKLNVDEGLTLYKELAAEHGYAHLSPHTAVLNALQKHIDLALRKKLPAAGDATNEHKPSATLLDYVQELFKVSTSVISNDGNVSKPEILAYVGTKNDDSENPAARKSEMTKKRKDLVEVYVIHISVMADLLLYPNDLEIGDLVSLELLQKSWKEMLKFADATDKSMFNAHTRYLRANGCLASAVTHFLKSLDSKGDKETEQLVIRICGELGWTHVQRYLENWVCVKYPPSYALI